MNYTDAPAGFAPLDGYIDAPEGFRPVEQSGQSWGDVAGKALKNAPRSLLGAGKMLADYTLPFAGGVQAGAQMGQDPAGTAEGLKEHYGKFFSDAGRKELLAERPFETAVEVGGLFAGGKGALARKPSTAMPRSVVRDGAELLETGGKRMTEAKLNPATVPANAIAVPMQKFRDALKTEAAIDLSNAELAPALKNRIARIEGAYAPPRRDPMANITKREPAAKPPISLAELHGHSKGLNDFINSTGKTEGRINEQGFIALKLKDAVDEMIDLHPESGTLKIGKHEFHRGAMNRTLEELLKKAQGRRQWVNGDEAGALSAEIALFLGNKKNRYALTPDARRKLQALSGDKKGRLVGAFGATNIGGFTFARGAEMALGMYPGMLAPLGVAARASRNARFIKEFERIQEEIRAGGPVRK